MTRTRTLVFHRKSIPLAKKQEIIQEFDAQTEKNKSKIAKTYGFNVATIRTILRNAQRDKVVDAIETGRNLKMKRVCQPIINIDAEMCEFIQLLKSRKAPITPEILQVSEVLCLCTVKFCFLF